MSNEPQVSIFTEIDPSKANNEGVLAIGGDLSTHTLMHAYQKGIFPWYNEGQPITWWSPDPRMVLFPEQIHISKSLKKIWRQQRFTLQCNTQFAHVIEFCAQRQANTQPCQETWLSTEMQNAYIQLHQAGFAHSIEAWQGSTLVGGLYGVSLGKIFFGESMFSHTSNASKIALLALCKWLVKRQYLIIDCQVENAHLHSMGAKNISRNDFLRYVQPYQNHAIHTLIDTQFGQGFTDYVHQ